MKITVETQVAAPILEVWRAFNDPDDIVQWDGCVEWQTISASNDLKVGGKLLLRTEATVSDETFDVVAIYTQIEPNRLIEFRMNDGRMIDRIVRLEFIETAAGVTVRQTFDAETEVPEEFQREEWQTVLDQFARYVERQRLTFAAQDRFRQRCEDASNYRYGDDYDEATFHQVRDFARLELPAYAEEVLQTNREDLYSEFKFDVEMSYLGEESLPDAIFSIVTDVICDPRFPKTRNGWSFLMIFESDWDKVTERQKAILLDFLGGIYEKFEDWMPCFSISELVGENYKPAQAFAFFNRFAGSSNETARSFLPHGYEHALRNSADAELTAKLWNVLLSLESDESEKVRGEVEETLNRLANHGLRRP